MVLAGAAAFGYSRHQPRKYTATAAISFSNNSLSQQLVGLPLSGGTSALLAQQAANLELVRLGDMAAKTASLVGHGLSAQEVSANLSVAAEGESGIVDVSATSTSSVLAAAVANAYVAVFVKEQQSAARSFFQSALAVVRRQLAELSPAQRVGADGLGLQNRAQTLSFLAKLGYNDVQVVQQALVPSSPSSPKTKRNTILGLFVGLLLGMFVALALERLDSRIREPKELADIYRLPMLGVVPASGALHDESGESELPLAEAEAFSLIRAHLLFFNVDRDVRTVMIASPDQGEGKTTTARYLAEAAARSGSRVLLLEFDLRQPTLAEALALDPGPGVAGVLLGTATLDGATRSAALRATPGEGVPGHELDVLFAGAILPPNPSELLESHRTDELLANARAAYDLVVIDTPPLTTVSDGFAMINKVDGVVVVGRVGHSRRDGAEQLSQVLASSGARTLGVIANGAKSRGPSPYPTRGAASRTNSSVANDGASPEQVAGTSQ
jgi:capsular exopolysaccharide synthesis family protein